MEASASRSRVFLFLWNFGSTVCKGSNRPCFSAVSTRDRSQEGIEGGLKDLTCSPKEPDDPVMLPHQLPFHGVVVGSNHSLHRLWGWRETTFAQHLMQEGQHDSDRAIPGVFSMRREPFDEQVPLQGVSMSRRWCSRQSDGADYLLG